MLDDVELREAQRDYLDFLDDEVRLGRPAWLVLGTPPVTRPGSSGVCR